MSDNYFTIKSPVWIVDPFPYVKKMLRKHHGVKLAKPKKHKVVVSPLNRVDWNRLEKFCKLKADGLNISYTIHDDSPKYHKPVSSQIAFQRWNAPLSHIAHECSHASSDIVRHVNSANKGIRRKELEEVRSYTMGFLVDEVEKLIRTNRVRTK